MNNFQQENKNLVNNKRMRKQDFYLQDEAFLRGDEKEHTSYIAKDTNKNGKVVTSFKQLDDFLLWFDRQPKNNRHFYEKILNERVEYYDIDGKLEDHEYWNNTKEKILDDFIKARKDWLQTTNFSNKDDNTEPLILESRFLKEKKSFHIFFRNGFLFKDNIQQKEYISDFSKYLEKLNTGLNIDLAPYGKTQCFRTLGSSKIGSDRTLIRSDYNEISLNCDRKLFFASYITPELLKASKESCLTLDTKLGRDMNCEYLNIIRGFKIKEEKDEFISLCENQPVSYETVNNLVDLILETLDDKTSSLCDSLIADKMAYVNWYKVVLHVFNSLEGDDENLARVLYNKIFPYYRHPKTVDKEQTFNNLYKSKGNYKTMTIKSLHYWARENKRYDDIMPKNKTYSEIKKITKQRRTKEEQKYLEDVNNKILNKQIESLFNYENSEFITKVDIPSSVEYVEDIVFPKGFRCIGLHAGLGRGKTTSLIRLVKKLPKDSKVLILSPRITFSKNICAEYNSNLDEDRQFICYLDYRKKDKKMVDLNFHNKVVMSMEGLHHLVSFTPDLLIVDEVNANLISHISVETNGDNIDENMYQFKRMLEYSKNVVVADAFLGSKVCDFFTDLKIPMYVYKYHRKLDKKDAVFLKPIDEVIKKEINKKYPSTNIRKEKKYEITESFQIIKKLLEQDKKLFCYFSTKSMLQFVERYIAINYNCEFYSGVSQNEIPDDLNTEWSKKDLVGTTSTITVGINHDKKDVFYTKIIDFSSSSKNNISDAIQSHYRVRHIISDKIYVSVEENHIASNFPINMESLDNKLKHRFDWYNKTNKNYSEVPIYINNLIKHNYIENQLSQVAPKKMMVRYLTDCNYNIVESNETIEDEDEEEKDEEEEDEKEEDEEKVDLLKEFLKDCPNQIRMIELNNEKLKRKLTEAELEQMEKFWFIQMYTGGTSQGYTDTKIPILALAYRLWTAKFKGNKSLRAMRLEKKVLEGKITIEELAEKRYDKTQFAELQKGDIIKISRMIEVCKKLGLKHSNDTDTEISPDTIDEFYEEAKSEYDNIRKDMMIEDKRKNKSDVNIKQFTGLIRGVFSNSEQSLCCLTAVNTKRKRINGKQVERSTYKLVPNKYILGNCFLVNIAIRQENEKEKRYDALEQENISRDMFDNLDVSEKDDNICSKKLLKTKSLDCKLSRENNNRKNKL